MRAVIDTNVIISAFIKEDSPPGAVLHAWRKGDFQLVSSPALLSELEQVISRPRIRARTKYSRQDEILAIAEFADSAFIVEADVALSVVTVDPDDDRVLEAATAAEADYIVSGDHDLLDLGSYDGITIVTPARFLAILSEEVPRLL